MGVDKGPAIGSVFTFSVSVIQAGLTQWAARPEKAKIIKQIKKEEETSWWKEDILLNISPEPQ